ncbi:MAG: retroviral-like aspartic protease family protein [Syntrophobacteraceae bacterium]
MKKIGFSLVVFCAFLCLTIPGSASDVYSVLSSGVVQVGAGGSVTVPFELVGHLIVVKASLDGSGPQYTFVLDTGSVTAVNKRLADRLGLARQGTCKARGADGAGSQVCLTTLQSLALGGMGVKNIGAVVFDPHFKERAGISVDGFIGSNFLRFFTVRIDYRRKLLTLSSATAPMASVPGETLVNIGLDWKNAYVPQVSAVSGDASFTASVDTGLYDPLSIPAAYLDRTNIDGQIEGDGAMASGNFGNMDKARMVRLSNLGIGPLRIGKVVATTQSGQTFALIGYGILSNYTVTIDYPAHQMLLAPVAGGKRMNNFFSTGLTIGRDYAGTYVAGVWTPSPAKTLGLAPGDRIIAVDGRPAGSYPLASLQKLLFDDSVPGIKLSVQEPAGAKKLTIEKRCLFQEVHPRSS